MSPHLSSHQATHSGWLFLLISWKAHIPKKKKSLGIPQSLDMTAASG